MFLEDLFGCSAICLISGSTHIVSMLKCMCYQNKVIHSFVYILDKLPLSIISHLYCNVTGNELATERQR